MFKKKKKQTAARKRTRRFGKDLDFASVEAYNLLRTNISFSLLDKEGGKVIGVTSPCPQEGKSTTSLNLSYALAEAGHKVILIDADMRRPSIAKAIDVPMVPGLSNILIEENEVAIHHDTLHENMSVLLSGNIPPNPSELVGSDKMKHLIEKLQTEYDYVILDLPPIISVSDPIAVSKHLDGIIVVVRHGHTRRRDIQEAIRQLRLVNARILGFVYNGLCRTKPHYHSQSYRK